MIKSRPDTSSLGNITGHSSYQESSSARECFGVAEASCENTLEESSDAQDIALSRRTSSTPFWPTIDRDAQNGSEMNAYQSITFMQPYHRISFEEIRLTDSDKGRRPE